MQVMIHINQLTTNRRPNWSIESYGL